MKNSKKIKLITSLSAVASAFGIGAATKSNVNNALTASTVDITTLSWVIRNVYNTNNTTEIKSIVEEDNKTLFAKFRNLKTAASITVTFNISESQPIQIVISADTAPYTGSKTWKASYHTPEPTPTPTPTPVPGIVSILYSELAELKNDENLPAGQQYRIVDYAATVDSSLTNAMSATEQYPFDIIITADSENSFNENVLVQARSDTSYTTKANFGAWTCKYSFDNDSSRFDWATTNGKGVIYYLQDEFGNEAPYDFKNILFTPYGTTGTPSKYTFDNGSNVDASITGDAYGNTIAPCRLIGNTISLNYIVFNGSGSFGNTLDTDCHDMVFGASCTSNKFGKKCANNTFCDSCSNNTIGNSFSDNSFKNSINGNTFGNSVTDIKVNAPASGKGLSLVLIKNDFGSGVNHITFANSIQFTKNTILSTGSAQNPLNINAVTWNGALPIAGTTVVSNPLVLHDRFGNAISSNVTWKASTVEGDAESYIESDSTGKPILKLIMGEDTEYCKIDLSAYVNDTKVTSIIVTVSPENQMVYDPGDGTDIEVILADDMDISTLGSTSGDFIFTTKEGETITITISQRSKIKSIKITSVKDGTTAIPSDFLGYCTNLKSVDLSGLSEITSINTHFLFNSSITTLDLSKLTKIQTINSSFLNSCRRLVELKLPTSCPVTTIGDYFLEYCSSLTSVDLSGFISLTSIGREFLYDCRSLSRIDLPDKDPANITVDDRLFMTSVPTTAKMYARSELVDLYKEKDPWSTRESQIEARP